MKSTHRKFAKSLKWFLSRQAYPLGSPELKVVFDQMKPETRLLVQIAKLLSKNVFGSEDQMDVRLEVLPVEDSFQALVRGPESSLGIRFIRSGLQDAIDSYGLPITFTVEVSDAPQD